MLAAVGLEVGRDAQTLRKQLESFDFSGSPITECWAQHLRRSPFEQHPHVSSLPDLSSLEVAMPSLPPSTSQY
jgi:hypothetical protein